MEQYTNGELGLLIKALTEKVEDGFNGVHARQDRTNGNVINNRTDIDTLKDWRSKVLGALIITQLMLVPLFISFVIKYFQ